MKLPEAYRMPAPGFPNIGGGNCGWSNGTSLTVAATPMNAVMYSSSDLGYGK